MGAWPDFEVSWLLGLFVRVECNWLVCVFWSALCHDMGAGSHDQMN